MNDDMLDGMVSDEDLPLEPRQQLFVDEYIIDFNATQAAIRAGYSEISARQMGSENLSKPYIKKAIDQAIADRRKRLRIDADTVLWKWWQIANADYNELSSVRRTACGFCHGDNLEVADGDDVPAAILGKDINPDCTACAGEGEAYVHMADTTNLSPTAKMLYQGAENTKFGIKINAADRMKALDNVARHLGMFKDVIDHQSSDGSMSSKPTVIRLVAPNMGEGDE